MRTAISAVVCVLVLSPALAQHRTPQPDYGEPNGTFPNWQERVVAELTNRARVAPSTELAACPPGQCLEAACYSPIAPLVWSYDLNQSARFHSSSMGMFPFFVHNTPTGATSYEVYRRNPGGAFTLHRNTTRIHG